MLQSARKFSFADVIARRVEDPTKQSQVTSKLSPHDKLRHLHLTHTAPVSRCRGVQVLPRSSGSQ